MEINRLIIFANIINFILYGVDKFRAKNNSWRIREKTLLTLSIFAGVGGFLGMEIFNHKTRERKFYLANIIGIFLTIYLIK